MKTIETKAAKFEAGKTYYTTWRKSDGCEQIITCTIEKRTAHSVTINGKRHMIPRIDGTLSYPDIEYILVTADDGWKVHVDARNIYANEEIAEDDAAVEAEIEIVNNAEEIAEVNDRRFFVSVHYDNNGANGMASKHFATSTDAANWIIAFAKENPECVINTDTNIRDFDAHKKYTLTESDIAALYNNEISEEIADITDAETADVIPVERFWCEVEIIELSEQDAADIVAHFHGQDGANKFFKMRATELDGSEEDIDGDNVFDYLPALDELNDVDIDDTEDNAGEVSEETADAKPTLTRSQLQKMIDGVIDEREEYFDALDEALADDEVPQRHIDYLNDMIEKLSNEYWELVKLYDNAPAEEIAG